jgi:hypothetical protein
MTDSPNTDWREKVAAIKAVALSAGAPGELRVPLALSRIVRLCIDALAAPPIAGDAVRVALDQFRHVLVASAKSHGPLSVEDVDRIYELVTTKAAPATDADRVWAASVILSNATPDRRSDDCGADLAELVTRLRATTYIYNKGPDYSPLPVEPGPLRLEAADAIERLAALSTPLPEGQEGEALQAEVERLREEVKNPTWSHGNLTDAGRARIMEVIRRNTAEALASPETARRRLIDGGFYTEDGQLTEQYGGPAAPGGVK